MSIPINTTFNLQKKKERINLLDSSIYSIIPTVKHHNIYTISLQTFLKTLMGASFYTKKFRSGVKIAHYTDAKAMFYYDCFSKLNWGFSE